MTKLEMMLKYVSEHNDFYKSRIKKYGITDPLDITQWPVLTRNELQENRYNMFSDGYKSKYFYQQLRRKSSSGSSGIPVNVYWDDSDYYASVKPLWKKRFQYYGVRPCDRQITFGLLTTDRTHSQSGVFYVNDIDYILNIDINSVVFNNNYHELVTLIENFKPVWLYVRPFILKILIKSYQITNKKPPDSIKYIESTGELLSYELKNEASKWFNCVIVNMYGSEEVNGISYECPDHTMRIIDDNVYVECMNNIGEVNRLGEGETIVTSLTNKAMPLIRYNQGDGIVLSLDLSENNDLNYRLPHISIIKGRTLDSININNEFVLNSLIFLEIMSYVNNQFSSIVEFYKFTYCKDSNTVYCNLNLEFNRKKWFSSVKKMIEEIFEKIIPKAAGIKIEVSLNNDEILFNKKNRIFEIK